MTTVLYQCKQYNDTFIKIFTQRQFFNNLISNALNLQQSLKVRSDPSNFLVRSMIGVIFRPHRRKSSLTIRYFPSVRMEIYMHIYAIFRPHRPKFTAKFHYEIQRLISVLTDGNEALNFAIFRPYKHWFSRWRHIIVQTTSTNQLNQTDPNANPNPNPKPWPY